MQNLLHRLRATAVVTAAVALLMAAAPMTAHADQPISTARYIALANAAMKNGGKIPDAARVEMATRPDLHSVLPTKATCDYELPGYVPDQSEVSTMPTTTNKVMDSTSAEAQAVALTTSTKSVDRYIIYENTFFFSTRVLDYHFVIGWSYNGRNVVGTPSSYSYVKKYTGSTANLGIINNAQYKIYNSNGVYAWTVPLTGKWQECSGSTCDYHYPQVRFGVYQRHLRLRGAGHVRGRPMIKHPVWRALIAAAVALVAIWLLSRVLLSISWLTTLSWSLAWLVAGAVGVAVFVGLGRSFEKVKDPVA